MNYVTMIYKETMDPKKETIESIEPIELEEDEANALRFAKLYQLQLPADLKKTTTYRTYKVKVAH